MAAVLTGMKGANEGIRLVGEGIEYLEDAFNKGGKLITAVERLASKVVNGVNEALAVSQEAKNKEIGHESQLRTTRCKLLLVVEVAFAFLDKMNDIVFYCQNRSMANARQELCHSPPNLKPLRNLIRLLKKTSTQANKQYLELMDECNKACDSCDKTAQDCERMERKSRNKKRATKGIGGAVAAGTGLAGIAGAAGTLAAGGVFLGVVFGPLTFGVSTVVGLGVAAAAAGVGGTAVAVGAGVATHFVAKDFEESEASFGEDSREFKSLLNSARGLKVGVVQVHTKLEDIATQVDSLKYNIRKEDIALIEDTLERLNQACTISYATTSRCRDEVESKMEELKAKLD